MRVRGASCFTYCLWITINGGSVSAQTEDSEKCTYISMRQTIESQAQKKLNAMNSIECEASDTEPHSVDCKTHDGRTKMMKLECFCARKTLDMDCQNERKVSHCCKYENVVCLNGGKLNKTESDCSGKRTPIYKCICPPVLGREGYYQGERCELVLITRECVYKANVHEGLNNCDDENDVGRSCIHNVINKRLECGPSLQNIDGNVNKKCEYYNDKVTPSNQKAGATTEHPPNEARRIHGNHLVTAVAIWLISSLFRYIV